MEKSIVAIVGGGPRAVYALERLLALLPARRHAHPLTLHIFDNTGRFGAGMAHSDVQSKSCYLNRPVDQIAFAADESVLTAHIRLPPHLRGTFHHWCQKRFHETGDKIYDLHPHDMPHRYIHGLALRDYFDLYATALRALPDVEVITHCDEVSRVSRHHGSFILHSTLFPKGFLFDYALFITGHTPCRPLRNAPEMRYTRGLRYIPYAYPLEKNLNPETVRPGNRLALNGMGLTAIDISLYLTEGRGGLFSRRKDGRLVYNACGKEPSQIVALSRSGKIYTTRPRNEKKTSADSHKPRFFCTEAIETLRRNYGVDTLLRDGRAFKQIDFERDVFPLIVLEMAWIYYRTLLGNRFALSANLAVKDVYQNFLNGKPHDVQQDIQTLLAPLHQLFYQTASALTATRKKEINVSPDLQDAAATFLRTLTDEQVNPGDAIERLRTLPDDKLKWMHSPVLSDHFFDWENIFGLRITHQRKSKKQYKKAILDELARDLASAEQGNISNPLKAACDGVWRDLRVVFSAVIDFGGLTPLSQKDFMTRWLSHYNRLSNGAGIEAMEKLRTLIHEDRVVIAPAKTRIQSCGKRRGYRLTGRQFNYDVHYVCCARLHPFDARLQVNPLYPSMLHSGLVRLWENRGAGGELFYPGALDLTPNFHPVDQLNNIEKRLAFLGAPAEGLCFFQNAAARPETNSAILSAIHEWAAELIELMTQTSFAPDKVENL